MKRSGMAPAAAGADAPASPRPIDKVGLRGQGDVKSAGMRAGVAINWPTKLARRCVAALLGAGRGLARLALGAGLTLAAASVLAIPARAQEEIKPPLYTAVDANGVDLISGVATFAQPMNSIGGEGPQGLSTSAMLRAGSPISSMNSYIQLSSDETNVYTTLVLMGSTMKFRGQPTGGGVTALDDATGKFSYPNSVITYTATDGTMATFQTVVWNSGNPSPIGRILSLKYPGGETLSFTRTTGFDPGLKVESSLGYALAGGFSSGDYQASAANLKASTCDTLQCSGTSYSNQAAQGRTLQVSGSYTPGTTTLVVTNPTGDRVRTYTIQNVADADRVVSYSEGGTTWTYAYSFVADNFDSLPYDGILTTTVTDPQGHQRVVKSRQNNAHIISDTDNLGHTTSVQYLADAYGLGRGKIYQITYPEGNRDYYEMDGYRNVTARWRIPKGASTTLPVDQIPGTTVERASYSCRPTFAGGQNCKSPDWIRDARGAQTDFAYDSVTGELLSVTKPAGTNGVRPQTRNTYASFTPRYLQNGAMTAAAPVRRLVRTSTCATGAAPACVGTADETVTDYVYEDSSQPNNVRLLSTTTRAGDNSLSATTSYAYTDRGDVTAVDGPLPGAADTTRVYYDASRWKTGEIGPDPDGTGPLLFRASRTTYRADGQVTLSETGTATSQSDGAMSSFAPLSFKRSAYDAQGRVVKVEEGQP